MFTFFSARKRRKLTAEITAALAEADAFLVIREADFAHISKIAEDLASRGHTATAHQYSTPARSLIERYRSFHTELTRSLEGLKVHELEAKLRTVREYIAALEYAPSPDDLSADPHDEVILRLGIENLENDAAHLMTELSAKMATEPKSKGAAHPSMIAWFRELHLEHIKIINAKSMDNFFTLTKRYEELQAHVEAIQHFKHNLT